MDDLKMTYRWLTDDLQTSDNLEMIYRCPTDDLRTTRK